MAEPEDNTADEDAKNTSSGSPNNEHAEAGTSSVTPAIEGGVGNGEEADKADHAVETADEAASKADPEDTSTSPGSGKTNDEDNDSNQQEEPKRGEDKKKEPATEEKEKTEDKKETDPPKDDDKPVPVADAADDEAEKKPNDLSTGPVVSSSKRTRPPYKYDPEKVVLRFLFANRDGLTVTVECKPADTVGEVKAQLLSVWPDGK